MRQISGEEDIQGPGPTEGLADEQELWRRLKERDDGTAREELVRRYLTFAKRLALRYRGTIDSVDDLQQVASLGLVNAIDRFDPERGSSFEAFAAPTILGELKRYFRDKAWTVRVPRGLHDRIAVVERAISDLTEVLQHSPSVREIAERTELDAGDILEVLEANQNRRALSLDHTGSPDDGDDGPSSGEWLGSTDDGYELIDDRLALEDAIPHLTERERLVLRLRFVEEMTQSEIAEQIGNSQMHVSRILRRTLERIREITGAGDEEPTPG